MICWWSLRCWARNVLGCFVATDLGMLLVDVMLEVGELPEAVGTLHLHGLAALLPPPLLAGRLGLEEGILHALILLLVSGGSVLSPGRVIRSLLLCRSRLQHGSWVLLLRGPSTSLSFVSSSNGPLQEQMTL